MYILDEKLDNYFWLTKDLIIGCVFFFFFFFFLCQPIT